MRIPFRRLRRLSVVAVVAVVAGIGARIGAAAPMLPRMWTTIDLSDVDPSPYRWKGPLEFKPEGFAMEPGDRVDQQAVATLLPFEGENNPTYALVIWHERQPEEWKKTALCGDGYLDERASFLGLVLMLNSKRVLMMSSKTHYVTVAWSYNRLRPLDGINPFTLDENVLARISRDLIRKIEPFAEPCAADAAARNPPPPLTSPPTGPERIATNSLSDFLSTVPNGPVPPDEGRNAAGEALGQPDAWAPEPPATSRQTPPNGGTTTNPIRTRDARPAQPDGTGALRQTGLPPGVEVVSLQFFESGMDTPPINERQYRLRFQGDQLRYLNWELHVASPENAPPFDFTVEMIILKNGQEYGRLTSKPFHLNPADCQPSCFFNLGWGSPDGTAWKPGAYEIQIWVNEDNVASANVRVD